jgi:hypothetical protein
MEQAGRRSRRRTRTDNNTDTLSRTRTHTHKCTDAQTETQTQTETKAQAHTHTHAQTQAARTNASKQESVARVYRHTIHSCLQEWQSKGWYSHSWPNEYRQKGWGSWRHQAWDWQTEQADSAWETTSSSHGSSHASESDATHKLLLRPGTCDDLGAVAEGLADAQLQLLPLPQSSLLLPSQQRTSRREDETHEQYLARLNHNRYMCYYRSLRGQALKNTAGLLSRTLVRSFRPGMPNHNWKVARSA